MYSVQIIAEVKTFSPFGWKSDKSWDELFELANEIGDVISIHTDTRWHGSFELLDKARKLTNKPILAKGIHTSDADVERAVQLGADYVLVVGRLPKIHPERCFIEPKSLSELASLPQSTKVVWNSRNLETGGLKENTFDDAREIFKGWLCQASNISNIADINQKADAVLIGTYLENFRI